MSEKVILIKAVEGHSVPLVKVWECWDTMGVKYTIHSIAGETSVMTGTYHGTVATEVASLKECCKLLGFEYQIGTILPKGPGLGD